jgi:PAS domain S-box-containing protein/diguanylate cyclase (GGDEF)-like protein
MAFGVFCLVWLLGCGWLIWLGLDVEALSPAGAAALAAGGVILFAGFSTAALALLLRRMQAGGGAAPWRVAADAAPVGIALTDRAGLLSYANPAFLRIFGLSSAALGTAPLDLIISPHLGDESSAELLPESGEVSRKLRLRASAGRAELDVRITRMRSSGTGWMVSVLDVTHEREAVRASAIYAPALEMATDGIVITRQDGANSVVEYVNKAFEAMTGYAAAELIGKDLRFLQGHDRMQPEIQSMREAIQRSGSVRVVLRNYRKDGAMFWNEIRLAPVPATGSTPPRYIAIARDATRLREAAQELERLASLDPLTGIANRAQFARLLNERLGTAAAMILINVDIQRFHELNTGFGFDSGDALLQEAAKRLQAVVPAGLVGRLSSNEFALAAPIAEAAEAEALVAEVRARLHERFVLPGASLAARFAIGFTIARPGDGARQAIRQASVALHMSKSSPIPAPCRYDNAADADIKVRVRLMADLQQAVTAQDFVLHYQPKVELATGAIVGAEALIRWQHPVFGLQPPSRFIPIAEESGLVIEIGEWALHEAVRFAARANAGRQRPLSVAVNISPRQFLYCDMVALLRSVLREGGIDPSWLVLELTESLFTEASPSLVATLRQLRGTGVGLAIDDFGTGYSNLRCLGGLPISEIKIDQRLTCDLPDDPLHRTIVEAIARTGEVLGVQVTAEGIEREHEARALRDLGCGYGQGYLLSMPLPPGDFMWLLNTYEALPVGGDRIRKQDAA